MTLRALMHYGIRFLLFLKRSAQARQSKNGVNTAGILETLP